MIGTGNRLKGLHQYDAKAVSELTSYETGSETLVQQSPAQDQDINQIVKRYGITAAMPFGAAAGIYADFSGITDYEDAVELVERAFNQFMTLPADVRERFGNDPNEMVRQVQLMSPTEFAAFAEPPTPPTPEPTVATMSAKDFVAALQTRKTE